MGTKKITGDINVVGAIKHNGVEIPYEIPEITKTTTTEILALFGITLPEKTDIITMNLDGTDRKYRVLKINDTKAEVIGMFQITTSKWNLVSKTTTFSDGTTAQQYKDSTVDTLLNTTWYDTLNNKAKAAICDTNRVQDLWCQDTSTGNIFSFQNNSNWTYKFNGTAEVGNRKIYLLNVTDLINYYNLQSGDTLDVVDLKSFFWGDDLPSAPGEYYWFASADKDHSDGPYLAWSLSGSIAYNGISFPAGIRPAFTIDLSKIDFTIEGGNN